MLYFFFFSSRRRHTRCYRDWSSDVCSSDLSVTPAKAGEIRIKSLVVNTSYFNDYAERIKEFENVFNIRGSVKQRERDVVMGGLGLIAQFAEGDAPVFDAGVEA